ncbi:uncharacterized protein LOC124788522 [Schistocerca piceifrons]|uniref:uncharacterized protein LOC124788522 n=1 Tax=Schistocerca piceifrons TaxID=274613 RepID=UPI001F5FC67C|nr:uncharacterized protein LOC124788522 [Schistocerca piceifrons]
MDSAQSSSHADEEGESDKRRGKSTFYDEDYEDKRASIPSENWRMARSSSVFLKTKSFPNVSNTYYNSLNLRKKRQITYTRHLSSEQNLRDLVKKSVLEGKWLCWHDLLNPEDGHCGDAVRKIRRKEILQFQLVQFEVAFNMEIADLVNIAKRSVSWNNVDMPKYLKRNIASTVDSIKKNSDVLLHELNCLWKEKKNFSGIYITYQKYMDKYEVYITYCRDLQKLREMIFQRNVSRPQVSEVKMSEIFKIERDLLPVFHIGLLCCVLEEIKKESTLKQLDQYHCCRTLTQLKKVEEECCKLVSKITAMHSTAYGFNKELIKKCKLYADRVFQENKCLSDKLMDDENGNPYLSSGKRNLQEPPQESVAPDANSVTQEHPRMSERDTQGYSENSSTIAVPKTPTKSFHNGNFTSNNSRNNFRLKELSTPSKISGDIQLNVKNLSNPGMSEKSRVNIFTSLSNRSATLSQYENQHVITNRQCAHTMLQTHADNHRHVKIFGDFLDTSQFYPRYSEVYKKQENFDQNTERVGHTKKGFREVSNMSFLSTYHLSDCVLELSKHHNEDLQLAINRNEEDETGSNHEQQKSVATQTKESSIIAISSHDSEEQCDVKTTVQQQTPVISNDTGSGSKTGESDSFKLIQALNIILIKDRDCNSKYGIKKQYLETDFDCDTFDLVQAINMPVIRAAVIETTFINPHEICEAINDLTVDSFNGEEAVLQEYDDNSENDSEMCEDSMSHDYENMSETSNCRQYTYSGGTVEMSSDNECIDSEEHYYENMPAENHEILPNDDYSFSVADAYKNTLENGDIHNEFALRGQSYKSSLSLRKLQKLRESFRSNKQRNLEEERYSNDEFEQLSQISLYQNFSFSSLPVFVDDGHQFIVDEAEPCDTVQKEVDEIPYESMTFTMRWKTRLQPGNKLPTKKRHHGFRTKWQDTEEVINSGLLDSMTPQQVKLQEAKFEIITSELSYYKSLCILERMFAENPTLNKIEILPHKDREILFSQVKPVKNCSQNFLKDLVTVWERDLRLTKMADTIIHHANQYFGVYVKYCENLQIIEKRLRQLMKNKRFATALKKIEDDEKCEKFPLYSFLMLPMQRATRFNLLAEAVLKYMQAPNEEYEKWCNACEALQSLAQDCNSSVKTDDNIKMKKSEETSLKNFFRNKFKMKK